MQLKKKKHKKTPHNIYRVGSSSFGPSPLSSRHGSQESLRHLNTMGSMSMLQTPTSSVRDSVSAAQKKKGIKSSLGRFFSKKEKVKIPFFFSAFFACLQNMKQYGIQKTNYRIDLFLYFVHLNSGKGCERFNARRFS